MQQKEKNNKVEIHNGDDDDAEDENMIISTASSHSVASSSGWRRPIDGLISNSELSTVPETIGAPPPTTSQAVQQIIENLSNEPPAGISDDSLKVDSGGESRLSKLNCYDS